MAKRKKQAEEEVLCELVVKGMQEKKARNIVKLDMRGVKGASADFFIICHADNDRQVEAIAGSVEEEVHKGLKEWPWHREGLENCEWVLLDYINVVCHVFLREKREFYGIEELWGDSLQTSYED
jgi:ribosome-associated protein